MQISKRASTSLIALAIVCLVAVAILRGQSSDNGHKFQLYAASVTAHLSNQTTPYKEDRAFKIDTTTGETWVFFSVVDEKGNLKEGWDPLHTYKSKGE